MTSCPFLGNQGHVPCSQEAQDYPAERASPGEKLGVRSGPAQQPDSSQLRTWYGQSPCLGR